ncbi:hypothetical protein Tco_0448503 [Tanacetum coccineum]
MDMLSFIRTADPMNVVFAVWLVVPLLPVAPARTSGELEASVEKLFGEGDGGEQVEQGDSAGGGQGVDIQPVIAAADTIVEDVAPLQPMRRKKRKIVVVDASGPSHPPNKLREDERDPNLVCESWDAPFRPFTFSCRLSLCVVTPAERGGVELLVVIYAISVWEGGRALEVGVGFGGVLYVRWGLKGVSGGNEAV